MISPFRGRRPRSSSSTQRCLALLLLMAPLAGCTLVQLHEDTREFYGTTVLVGRIAGPPDWQAPVAVAAVARNGAGDAESIVHRVWLHEAGGYELIVPDGRYTLQAFGDANANGRPDPGEPTASLASELEIQDAGIVTLLDLTLAPSDKQTFEHIETLWNSVDTDADAQVVPVLPPHSTQAGAIADLDAPAFSAENGRLGYWSPLETFRRSGGNIYFLEPYDPQRIPVLFVHGATGSAQDWRAFFDALDRSRYQAWFFQYPSGAPLESMSHLLYWKLLNLQVRYRFEHMHVVAHSMGGLLMRRFLLDRSALFPQMDSIVTLSTPWEGAASAALGVQHSPAVVPSWRDLLPEGDFLRHLFEQPLPPEVPHTLLFSHRGDRGLFGPNSDGSVTLASQLRPQAQAEARLVMGFDEDHRSILRSNAAIQQTLHAIDAVDSAQSAPGGRVVVQFPQHDELFLRDRGLHSLVLTPMSENGKTNEPLLLPLALNDAGHALGPVPVGRYEARFAAHGYRSQPLRRSIEVTRNGVTTVEFKLVPQGVLVGQISLKRDAVTQPAGSYERLDEVPNIRRVLLEGPAGRRVLTPMPGSRHESLQAYLDNEDALAGTLFHFVDLAPGEYRLTIEADGYDTHVSQHRIVSGHPTAGKIFRLTAASPGR